MTADFSCLTGSVTTAATVTSDPVPAVVGIANSGSIGFDTLSMPMSCSRRLARHHHGVDDLRGVDDRTAADCENRVAAMQRARPRDLPASTGNVGSGVMRVVDRDVDALRGQRLADRLDDLQFHEHRVGHDHDAPETELADARAEPQRGIRARRTASGVESR